MIGCRSSSAPPPLQSHEVLIVALAAALPGKLCDPLNSQPLSLGQQNRSGVVAIAIAI